MNAVCRLLILISILCAVASRSPLLAQLSMKNPNAHMAPAGTLTPEEQKRLAARINQLTPKQRKQLAKAVKKMTPAQQEQFAASVRRQVRAETAKK